ncbi:MAG: EAL domain-containing protein [Acidimicrobiia bacterium]
MSSTGWKEWKKKDMTADGVEALPTIISEPDRAPSAELDAPPVPSAEDWNRIADANGAFRRAVESTTDLVTFHARGGDIIFANRAAREVIGVGPDDPLPRVDIHQFFDTTPVQLAEMRQSIIDHGQWSGELDVCGVDFRIPASVVISGHRDENGRYEHFSALSRDISERRANDAARRRSEAALRSIVQSSPLPILAVDAAGTVHVWNRASEDLFGWSASEAIGSLPPFIDSGDEMRTLTAPAFNGETVRSHEARYASRDGRPLDVNVAIAPLRNAAGRVISAVVVVADVSDRKRAELALRESEVRFRSLVQNSSDMVTIIDSSGRVTYRSPSACQFVGLDPESDPDVPVDAALCPEDRPALAALLERLRSKPGAAETIRYRFRRADGELRWIEMVATDHSDDPAVLGVVTNSRDVTDRVEVEDAVRASEKRLSELVANISDAISVIDADGGLQYSSPTSEQVFGYPNGAWPEGRSIFDTVHPDDRDRILELWAGAHSKPGRFRPLELRLQRGDGSWMDAEIIANNLLDDPAVNGIVVTSRDITERKRSDEALRASESRLRESEARYRAVVDDQTELVCRYRPDATLTFANRAFCEFFGCHSDALAEVKLVDLRPASERPRLLERLESFPGGASVRTHVEREVSLDGSLRWYQWTDRAFVEPDGSIVEIQSVGHDVTDQRRAAEFAAHQAEILEQVARGVALKETLHTIAGALEGHFPRFSCAIMLLDAQTSTLRVGAAPSLATRLVERFDGTPVSVGAITCGAAAAQRKPVYVCDVAVDDRWIGYRDIAQTHGIHASWSTPIVASDGSAVLGTLDVFVAEPRLPADEHLQIFSLLAQLASIAIERKAFEEDLAHQSMHDPLTGLPNRLLFLDRLGQSIARCQRTKSSVGVVFLDLDRFKNINDSLGHDAGDELLVAVAHKLESVIRPGDTVARFGGDEFTVLCEDLTADTARETAVEISERLLATVIRPMVVREAEMFVGASVGIALALTGDERPEELLRDADAAMHHAKEAGRGRVEVFDDTMHARALTAHSTENALHRALERGELRLFFQPIVGLSDARCIGAEALVRWQHPERGLLGPAEFIPLAEETGLVVPLGWWVIEEAARNAARWQLEHAEPFQVSINLSARQLVQPDLADRVADVIAQTGVRPSNVCFEITESVLMDDTETVIDVISRVRALGVEFAIDDFGTGYSSLGYLKRFPVDAVKIDRSFVTGLGTDPGDAAIVSAVIGLAHALGLRVTAEGVETEEQLATLIGLGCDEAQGYFFLPPQPAPDLRSLIANTRTWRPPGATVMRPAGPRRGTA